jgi:glutathionylspermidine synthase
MQRLTITARPNWQKIVESKGFHFHSLDDQPYWDETVCYKFTARQIDEIERATYALDKMCIEAVDHVVQNNLFDRFQIPPAFVPLLQRSWEHDEATVYGRFDFSYDGESEPKLLEYNADTPTSLLEAAVIQWYWMQDVFPNADQFNSIHDRLIEAWKIFGQHMPEGVWFTSISGNVEDFMTVNYLRDTAIQAGLKTTYIEVERIGWNHDRQRFVDENERHMSTVFKLYPWEWMIREKFGDKLLADNTYWLESPWKMLLSNKAILPILWELYPDSPYLLPASFEPMADNFVRKPILSREGANIQIVSGGKKLIETDGIYGGPYVYQEYCPLPNIGGNYPLIGSWMVNGYACGMGIREDATPVTGNTSRFVPHFFTN